MFFNTIMPANFLDHISSNVLCVIASILASIIAVAGLLWFDRIKCVQKMNPSNEMTGIIFGAISLIYSLVLAFVFVAVWGNYEDLNQNIEAETDRLNNILTHSVSLPDSIRQNVDTAIRSYCQQVISKEWRMEDSPRVYGVSAIPNLRLMLLNSQPQTALQQSVFSVLDEDLSSISDLRRSRLSHNRSHIPSLVWFTLGLGSILLIVFSYLFNVPSRTLKCLYIASLAAAITMSLFLVYTLDRPFNGHMQVSVQPYVNVMQVSNQFHIHSNN